MTDEDAINKIKAVIIDCMNTGVKTFPELKESYNLRILCDLKGKDAGQYLYFGEKSHTIRINKQLLIDNENEMLDIAVPHEIAHLIVVIVYGADRDANTGNRVIKPHGKEWKHVMSVLGKEHTRLHTMKVKNWKWIYECDCDIHNVSTITHNRIAKGVVYYCKKCGSNICKIVSD